MVEDPDILGIIAVLQQTVEHELGHYKYHNEGVNDPSFAKHNSTKTMANFNQDMPNEDMPLDGEAGYTVQSRICQAHGGTRHGGIIGINECLGPKRQLVARNYVYHHSHIEMDDEGRLHASSKSDAKPLRPFDIAKMMNYPKDGTNCVDLTVHPLTNGDGSGPGGCGSGSGGSGDGSGDGAGDGAGWDSKGSLGGVEVPAVEAVPVVEAVADWRASRVNCGATMVDARMRGWTLSKKS